MDIVSHALWAGAAAEVIRRTRGSSAGAFATTVALGAAPDIGHLIPVLGWSLTQSEPAAVLHQYIAATPGTEPPMPWLVRELSHHLHCLFHSIVVLSLLTLLVSRIRPGWTWILAGWWLHVVLDIPTHSSEYYGVPILYPFSEWSFDGVAWTTPWVLATNAAALAATYASLYATRRRRALTQRSRDA